MDTKFRKIQTAIFTKNFNLIDDASRAQFLLDIKESSRVIFDASPVQVPIPSNAPPEFPRIILNSIDGRFNCNITLSRTDVIFNVPENNTQSLADLLTTQKNNFKNIFDFLVSKSIVINRIGFIVVAEKLLSQGEGGGCAYLKNNFIKDTKFNNSKELIFRYNQAGNSENFGMNNLININGKASNRILVQTDINTLAELMGSASFNSNNLNEIIDYMMQKTQDFINNFPNI